MFAETADQSLLESSTAQLLSSTYSVERVRELRHQDSTFDPDVWKRGAELGWTALLVPDDLGGGSVSGNGLADLASIAFQFGRHAAPGPLIGSNLTAFALARWGSTDQRKNTLGDLVTGTATGAWGGAATVSGRDRAAGVIMARACENELILDGHLDAVEEASHYLLGVEEQAGRAYMLVPASTSGVRCVPMTGVDLTRRYHRLTLHDVRLPVSARVGLPNAGPDYDRALLDVCATLQSAEIVGAMQRAFDITLKWTFERYSFGRPLGSYQEIKHRVADMRTQLEASAGVTARAAYAVGTESRTASQWAGAAKAYTGLYGQETIQDCIQLHGGIGVTSELDLHLFLRRTVVNAQLFGTPTDFMQRLTWLAEIEETGN